VGFALGRQFEQTESPRAFAGLWTIAGRWQGLCKRSLKGNNQGQDAKDDAPLGGAV
jgi:hypothetical protein